MAAFSDPSDPIGVRHQCQRMPVHVFIARILAQAKGGSFLSGKFDVSVHDCEVATFVRLLRYKREFENLPKSIVRTDERHCRLAADHEVNLAFKGQEGQGSNKAAWWKIEQTKLSAGRRSWPLLFLPFPQALSGSVLRELFFMLGQYLYLKSKDATVSFGSIEKYRRLARNKWQKWYCSCLKGKRKEEEEHGVNGRI